MDEIIKNAMIKLDRCIKLLYEGKDIIAYNKILGLRQILQEKEIKNDKTIMNIKSEIESCINIIKNGQSIQVYFKLINMRKILNKY